MCIRDSPPPSPRLQCWQVGFCERSHHHTVAHVTRVRQEAQQGNAIGTGLKPCNMCQAAKASLASAAALKERVRALEAALREEQESNLQAFEVIMAEMPELRREREAAEANGELRMEQAHAP